MTTLLSRVQVDTLRSIGDSALVLMALWMIDCNYPGRASKAQEIAMCIRKDTRTVEKQLNELCATNRAANTSAGYILLESGRALILSMNSEALALSPAQNVQAQLEAQAQIAIPSETPIENRDLRDTHNARALGGGVRDSDSLKKVKNLTSPPEESGAQNVQTVQALTTLQILEASTILFGEDHEVVRNHLCLELLDKDNKFVLAVLAHCYDNRKTPENPSGLHTPAGVAYRMLESFPEGKKPRREYGLDPWAFLPNEFKEVFGLACYDCNVCHQTFAHKTEFEHHLAKREGHAEEVNCTEPECEWTGRADFLNAHLRMHEDEKREQVAEAASIEEAPDNSAASILWKKVKLQLSDDMPRASFDTWVRDSAAVSLVDSMLTVGTRNAYARDWMDSRMKGTIERLLFDISGTETHVEFISS